MQCIAFRVDLHMQDMGCSAPRTFAAFLFLPVPYPTQADAVTSLHKDHYENMYCVLAGEKEFILFPPTDYPFLDERPYRASQYHEQPDGSFSIVPVGSRVEDSTCM